MNHTASVCARRDVLRSAGGLLALFAGSSLLGACGGGGEGADVSAPVAVVPGGGIAAGSASPLVVARPETSWMNFALALQYVGAQYYGIAANGSGLASALQGGVGVQGAPQGGRKIAFTDPFLSQYAGEFASDQADTVAQMRSQLGAAAGAQPAIDFSSDAFGVIGRAAGIGGGFDPFAGDTSFLLGGAVLEYGVAAAYRAMLTKGVAAGAEDVLTAAMGGSIYRSGLIRALLEERAQDDAALTSTMAAVFTALSRLEASDPASQAPETIDQASSSVTDGAGNPIALTRSADEVFRLLYLNVTGTSGGLLPKGVNGVDSLPGVQ